MRCESCLLDLLVEIKEENLFSMGDLRLQGLLLLQPGEMAFTGMDGLVTQAYGREGWGAGNSLIGSNRLFASSTLKT